MRLLPRTGTPTPSRTASPAPRRGPAIPGRPPAWQRRFLRHRRLAAALLAGFVVWSTTTALRPPAAETALVATARHDLAPGTTLTDDDLAVSARAR